MVFEEERDAALAPGVRGALGNEPVDIPWSMCVIAETQMATLAQEPPFIQAMAVHPETRWDLNGCEGGHLWNGPCRPDILSA